MISWESYFKSIVKLVAERSSCCRRQVGAVLVKDNKIISTGYNGTPSGMLNCNLGGCPRCNNAKVSDPSTLGECLCVHAEENTIIQAALSGVSPAGSIIYITDSPCLHCCKLLVSAGIKEINYLRLYDQKAIDIFEDLNLLKFYKV
jgi:dCMP deaminase